MLNVMDEVGTCTRFAFHWVPQTEKCWLVMDNVGGHGTKEPNEEYVRHIKDKHNITILFKIPRSLYTNVLDLGAWCGLQAAVEKRHFMWRCEVNALVKSVFDTWSEGKLDRIILNLFQ